MTTIKIHAPVYWNHKRANKKEKNHIWDSLVTFAHNQVKNQVPMFKNLVIVQCALFLPLLALLMFGFHTPLSFVVITIALFLANIIISMDGSGMRTINGIFALGFINLSILFFLFV